MKRHFPGTLKITVCPPANAKKLLFPSQSHPPSRILRRWGSGPVLEGVWEGVQFVLGGGE